jgi:hypothetical protein
VRDTLRMGGDLFFRGTVYEQNYRPGDGKEDKAGVNGTDYYV